jgi:putative DNA primase/helicase
MSKTKVTPLRNPHATIDNIDGVQSEDDLALGFVNHLMLADDVPFLRYCAEWSKWMHWDGKRWARERTLAAYDKVRQFLRHMVDDSDRNSRRSLGKSATVAAVERMAQADRRCASVPEDWDPDPFLMNTPGGVVDLNTGEVGRHRPDLFMTKIATAEPAGDCPRWLAFLDDVTGGDVELQRFLQRMAGYCLTGSTRDHALFFLYGTGGNGKGVFLNTLTKVLGEYARVAPMETFTESKSDRHPTELAMLQGARLVVAQETEEGRRWAESRIKSMTGGDPITARWMRGDFFTFVPQFKLVIAGNHKPGLRAVDEAIRRRLYLIPFAITIPPERRDPHLPDALLAEAGGILRWAIEGCLAWQREGLNPPKAVRDTTADYLEAQDSLQAWIEDCCEVNPNRWELPGALFASWKAWAEKAGEPFGTQRSFGDRLEASGFLRSKTNGTRRHIGLALKAGTNVATGRDWD